MQVAPGHSILVTGPNGSGKSSLFRLLGGLWPLTQGQIRKPGSNSAALLSSDIFYVPQKPYTTIGSLREQVKAHCISLLSSPVLSKLCVTQKLCLTLSCLHTHVNGHQVTACSARQQIRHESVVLDILDTAIG